MSAARNTRTAKTSAKMANATAPVAQTITLPTLSALFTPTLNTNMNKPNAPCNCGNCCQTSSTICLTFDTTWLQNLVNIFPKIQLTNNNSCVDNDCEDCDDDEMAGK